jgi:hypothetical protein
MRSFAGLYNPQLRLRVALGSIAFAAFAVSLLLAFASVTLRPPTIHAPQVAAPLPNAAAPHEQIALPAAAPRTSPEGRKTAPLWTLLARWALAVDVVAIVGLIAMMRMWRR